ncbi:GNAT family N-acetyltransferase [Gilvimarinus sp. SDUM040013]|uniref:GNAT family N-acetyltransferase n=1 Tax=Gilvimarinus gilvus TaxID=3058038 RepID=A0ABU4RVU0_9GAMM|nr:GNAT family N-acetyltransferase [Gilvimarinus sp. SDUM040013]MDO3388243.1 GNAT family N-acetyltransferase [Gilvimarinus sp. SDUM040013]MDX6847793.1 GNAT family N-acetyltransferase [Gilvimarinus sp. SDUM040013]
MVELRSFRKEDARDLAKNANNSRVAQFLPDVFPSPYPVEAAQWWVAEGYQLGDVFNQAIIIDGECAGSIGVTFLEGVYKHTAKLGFWLGEPYWGKGIMTKTVNEFVSHVFDEFSTK